MAYKIDIPASLLELMGELPPRTRASIQVMLEELGALAGAWLPEDPRWERLARLDGEGLCFYADGCCVRVQLLPGAKALRVREIGRVLVHLPADVLGLGLNA